MKAYLVVAHTDEGLARRPIRAFAALGEDHHEAVSLVRHHNPEAQIDIDAVLHLREETAARLRLSPGEVWQL